MGSAGIKFMDHPASDETEEQRICLKIRFKCATY